MYTIKKNYCEENYIENALTPNEWRANKHIFLQPKYVNELLQIDHRRECCSLGQQTTYSTIIIKCTFMQIAIDSLDFLCKFVKCNCFCGCGKCLFQKCERKKTFISIRINSRNSRKFKFMAGKVLLNVKGFCIALRAEWTTYYCILLLMFGKASTKNEKSISSLRIPDRFLEKFNVTRIMNKVWHQCIK